MRSGARRAALVLGLLVLAPGAARASDSEPSRGALLLLHSDSACPASVKVSERVAAILGLPVGTTIDELAELTHEGSGLTVRLRGKDQRILGERVLPPDEDCGALEQAAATRTREVDVAAAT